MKLSLIIFSFTLFCASVFGQAITYSPIDQQQIITSIQKAQAALKNVSYTMERTDTLGDFIRTMKGTVVMEMDKADTTFGFKFRAKLNSASYKIAVVNTETVYDGRTAYVTNGDAKTYTFGTDPSGFEGLLNGGGGWLIVPDLVKVLITDPSSIKQDPKLTILKIAQDADSYYITLNFPDLKKPYDVDHRWKTITIDKKTMLPSAMREHHMASGSVQDLYYRIKDLQINSSSFSYNFSSPPFLKEYTLQVQTSNRDRQYSDNLTGHEMPGFSLSFKKDAVSTNDLKGKVVLLDFWEAWCTPCLESMPKVQHLYEKYKDQGLDVYGITNDISHLENAKTLVSRLGYSFPMLTGNEKLKSDYKLTGSVPLYILIDKKGVIKLVTFGYAPNMEEIIQSLL